MDGGLDDRTLRRIIALLVSFAALAERAAGRSLPVRWLVLAIIRYAEAVALDLVADKTGIAWAYVEDGPETGCTPMDAALLARRLRALAILLAAFLGSVGPIDGWASSHFGWAGRSLLSLVGLFAMLAGGEPAFQDTS